MIGIIDFVKLKRIWNNWLDDQNYWFDQIEKRMK